MYSNYNTHNIITKGANSEDYSVNILILKIYEFKHEELLKVFQKSVFSVF
jgi:hypothetical protein